MTSYYDVEEEMDKNKDRQESSLADTNKTLVALEAY